MLKKIISAVLCVFTCIMLASCNASGGTTEAGGITGTTETIETTGTTGTTSTTAKIVSSTNVADYSKMNFVYIYIDKDHVIPENEAEFNEYFRVLKKSYDLNGSETMLVYVQLNDEIEGELNPAELEGFKVDDVAPILGSFVIGTPAENPDVEAIKKLSGNPKVKWLSFYSDVSISN